MQINGRNIKVRFVKKNVRRTFVKIAGPNEVVLTSFRQMSTAEVDEMLESHREWIEKQVQKYKSLELKENEIILFGSIYEVVPAKLNKSEYEFRDGKVFVGKGGVEALYRDGYKKIEAKFSEIGEKLGKKSALQFRKMKTKWGVCHIDKKKIVLNKVLVKVPLHLVEYIIYHEYTHYEHANHSKAYYEALAKVCPNHKQLKNELTQYSFLL